LKKVIEGIILDLNRVFGQESPLMTTHAKVVEYLGMTSDYTKKEKSARICRQDVDGTAFRHEWGMKDTHSITFV